MFRFTQTTIRELQPVLCQSYNMDSNIQVTAEVFGIMAAYLIQSCRVCVLCTVQNETVSFVLHSAQYTRTTGLSPTSHFCVFIFLHFNLILNYSYILTRVPLSRTE